MSFSKVNVITPFFEKKVNKTIEGCFVVGRYFNPTHRFWLLTCKKCKNVIEGEF